MPDPDVNDVPPESSPAPDALDATADPGSPDVTGGDSAAPTDRPWTNVQAEWNRKHSQTQTQIEGLMAMVAQLVANQSPPSRPGTPSSPEYTEEQLAQLAAAGDANAQRLLAQRTAERVTDQRLQQHQRVTLVQQQRQALYVRYPKLSDSQHPFTQAAMRAKGVLLQTGWANDPAADVEAIKIAAADFPQLAVAAMAETSTDPPNDAPRQAAAGAASAMTGTAPRRPAPRTSTPATKLSPKAREIAQRMGVKDPDKAMERWQKRMDGGRSAVSPQVAMILHEQGDT